MLTGNLGDKLIPQNEILRDVSDLKALANLHESMEWLAARLKTFFTNLPQTSSKSIFAFRPQGIRDNCPETQSGTRACNDAHLRLSGYCKCSLKFCKALTDSSEPLISSSSEANLQFEHQLR